MRGQIEEKGITMSEMKELFAVNKSEMVDLMAVNKSEMVDLIVINRNEMMGLLSEQFALVFKQIDTSIHDLRVELRGEIGELRNDMNHRFTAVEKRLSSIESKMVYRYEHDALVHRVEKLEE